MLATNTIFGKLQNRMRVLFILPGSESEYSMIFAKRQIDSLKKLGVTSFTFYLQSRLNPVTLFTERFRFRKCIADFKPDIIHSHYGTMTAFFAAFSNTKPLVITYHGSDLNFLKSENFFLEIIRKILSQTAALRATAIVCVSGKLKKKLFWRKRIASVIPMGVDENFFKPVDYHGARKKLNIGPDEKIILFNYNHIPVKREDIARKTLSIVQQRVASAKLKILNGNVAPDEMVLLFNASDCLLLCSDAEGSPMMVKEAMACNLPVVSSDVGDVKQNIEATFPKIITEQDPQMLADGIIEILKLNQRSNGRDILYQLQLTEKNIALRVMDIYNKVLNG